ncbi:MerR family transcriptional regulator [Deinococcus maricopensis]|uniref:Transcriptional regulator, MerR family n=1 Tax=Deinococcus maricopensis (strain DSM 21211 / LMG 22137 / NRRL B-23946 / LB-34) TaxID=709986 RepID=E8UAM3_DEIML|nr:MerR family transcriptional regulator [Deinococcus maricopensis]ADV68112.1 transcriptional regulator, MerR family [Deinococcus maricopensis DSM 21211]
MSNVSNNATGLYTTSEVEARTGVPATTLRQWERRYGLPNPTRSASGYRLYSEHDLQLIEFMQLQLARGITISRAAELARARPEELPAQPATVSLAAELCAALMRADHTRAGEILSRAHAHLSVERVLMEVITPTLVEIGMLWERGEITVAHEHQASAYLRARLTAMLEFAGTDTWGPSVVLACAPGEQHELGLLMVAVVLRRAGVRVHYMGANTPLADLAVYARLVGARAVLLSLNGTVALDETRAHLRDLADLRMPVFYGGSLMNASPEVAETLGGLFAGPDAVQAARQLLAALREAGA